MKELHCPACDSRSISPIAALSLPVDPPNPKWPSLVLGGFEGWTGMENFWIKIARVCGDCGHVMMFLDDTALAQLKENWQNLAPARIAAD
jgi:hypothetical protein